MSLEAAVKIYPEPAPADVQVMSQTLSPEGLRASRHTQSMARFSPVTARSPSPGEDRLKPESSTRLTNRMHMRENAQEKANQSDGRDGARLRVCRPEIARAVGHADPRIAFTGAVGNDLIYQVGRRILKATVGCGI